MSSAVIYLMTLYLQDIVGLSPLVTGLTFAVPGVRGTQPQVTPENRQRHVQDREIDRQHELRADQQGQDQFLFRPHAPQRAGGPRRLARPLRFVPLTGSGDDPR
jgi:hypothetical protein